MTFSELCPHSFKALRQQIKPCSFDFVIPSMKMIEACRADAFDFFQPAIAAGLMTEAQMKHACEHYYLGKSKSGKPIFWTINDMMRPLNARIGDTWISEILKARNPELLQYWPATYCLFGEHLLGVEGGETPISLVESEASAVVLSELFPESIWLAYGRTPFVELFTPLTGRTIIFYPRTDPSLSNYLFFLDLADLLRNHYDINVTVDTTLEDRATPAQKARDIDILDFILES